MPKVRTKSRLPVKPDWATTISDLRRRLGLSQTAFGQRLHSSAMGISRWERGAQEPPASSYVELGTLAGDPLCWYFWGRAGLRKEDLMRVMPKLSRKLSRTNARDLRFAAAGSGNKKGKGTTTRSHTLTQDGSRVAWRKRRQFGGTSRCPS